MKGQRTVRGMKAEDRFNLTKTMLNAGLKQDSVMKALNVSSGYVSIVRHKDTFEDYQKWNSERQQAKKMKQELEDVGMFREVAERVIEEVDATPTITRADVDMLSVKMDSVLSKMNELMARQDEFEKTYAWVAEHAVIDNRKRRWL